MIKRNIQSFFALITVILSGLTQNAIAQSVNASSYQFTALAGNYADIVGGTAVAGLLVDNATSGVIDIGFTFNFCGVDYTQLKACSNGWCTFNPTNTSTTATNSSANIATIKPGLMPLFDDLAGWGTGAAVNTIVTGAAPNRVFTIEFKNWNWKGATGNPPNISFQVKLYETTNVVEYIYRQEAAAGNPGGATIGIGDGLATPTYLSLNNATATATASSTTVTTNIVTKPATGQIYRFKPAVPSIDIKADSLITDASFCYNASSPVSMKVTNKGTATINNILVNWSVDGVNQAPVYYIMPTAMTNILSAPNNIATIPLGDVFFPDASARVIKAWVVQANDLQDAINTNDTINTPKAANLTGVIVNINPHNAVICGGTEVTLDAGTYPKNPVYIWPNGHTTQTIQVSTAGTYSVKVQNTDGCFDYDTVTVSSYPNPAVNSIASVDNADGSYTFTAVAPQDVASYVWDFGDGQTQAGTGLPGQAIHQYVTEGDYIVTLTLTNNQDCGDVTVTSTIHSDGIPTGINDLDGLQTAFSIYPNPTTTQVVISNDNGIKIESIVISNIIGQQVFRKDHISATKFQFNTTDLATGIYNVVIDSEKGKIVKKLEVIH